jgi:hypothetical protein
MGRGSHPNKLLTAALWSAADVPLSPPHVGSLKRKRQNMTSEPTPFIEYWEAVDAAMLKFFGIHTSDAGKSGQSCL